MKQDYGNVPEKSLQSPPRVPLTGV
jgi:hypothetical protein